MWVVLQAVLVLSKINKQYSYKMPRKKIFVFYLTKIVHVHRLNSSFCLWPKTLFIQARYD